MKQLILLMLSSLVAYAEMVPLQRSQNVSEYLANNARKGPDSLVQLHFKPAAFDDDLAGRVQQTIQNANLDSDKAEMQISRGLKPRVQFNNATGRYFHINNEIGATKLISGADQSERLKEISKQMIETILLDEAGDYFFANEDIEYIRTNDDIPATVFSRSFRFVKKIKGRYVVDNSAFVQIGFSANEEIYSVEIQNPILIESLVRSPVERSITWDRLQLMLRENADFNGFKAVNTVIEKAYDTFVGQTIGKTKILVPSVSFFASHTLENGQIIREYVHLPMDFERVTNADREFITSNSEQRE